MSRQARRINGEGLASMLAAAALLLTGCGDDSADTYEGEGSDESVAASDGGSDGAGGKEGNRGSGSVAPGDAGEAPAAKVTAACDALEDLATAILDVREAIDVEAVTQAVEPSLRAFVSAAEESGDDLLADLAGISDGAFSRYVSLDEGAEQAGLDFDTAIDQAARRCLDLGATNDFPESP